jgi:hypothetical protein
MDVLFHAFLTSALGGGKWSASQPTRFSPRGKCRRYPLDKRLGGPQSQMAHPIDGAHAYISLTLETTTGPCYKPNNSRSYPHTPYLLAVYLNDLLSFHLPAHHPISLFFPQIFQQIFLYFFFVSLMSAKYTSHLTLHDLIAGPDEYELRNSL